MQADVKANRPVVVFAFDWIARWLPLRMTLDAGVVGVHIAEAGRVEDGGTHRMLDVGAARPVALLAADVPFTDGFGRDVIVHRMAAIAERTSRALEIIWRIKRGPPIGTVRYEISLPHAVCDIPLRRLREVVVADLGEISLLPACRRRTRCRLLKM